MSEGDRAASDSHGKSGPGGRVYFLSTFTSTRVRLRSEVENSPPTPDGNPKFLFSLPEYAKAFDETLDEVLEQLTERKSPVLRELVTRAKADHVRTQRVTTSKGEVVSIPPKQSALPIRFTADDVVRFDLSAFANQFDAAAEVLTDEKLDHILSATDQIAEANEQTANAQGRGFGWPVLLEALEKVGVDFADSGEPILPKIVAEKDKRHFLAYPPLTPEHQRALDELVERKRKEFNARRGRR